MEAAKDLQIDYSGIKSSTSSPGGCYRDSSNKDLIFFNKNLNSSPDPDNLKISSQNAVCRKGKLNKSVKFRYMYDQIAFDKKIEDFIRQNSD